MIDVSFTEQAKQRTLAFFQAYYIDNDMEKMLSFFSKHSAFVGWGSKELYFDYEAIAATAHERMTIPFYGQFDDVSMEVINASENFCVVLFSANIAYRTDNGNDVHGFERATFVYRREQGEPKIVYLHSSAGNKVHDLGKILPLEHGAEVTRRLTQLECDRSMAVDMCEHTPNGLLYCLIGEHFPLVYANQTLCDILGYKDFSELMEATKGQMDCCIYQADLERLKQVLLSFTNGVPYTVNYRMFTKQGQLKWIMERGRYVLDADTGEEYYICTIIPLELEQSELSYGNLVDYTYIENAPLSVERFLEQTLDYNDFHDRTASCHKLLQHCCETLQASCAVLYSIKDTSAKISPVYYYDKLNYPLNTILQNFSWNEIAPYFDEDNLSLCSDINNIPNPIYHGSGPDFLRSGISKVISVQGKDTYLLSVYHRGRPHTWTESEQDILLQASKLFSLLLDEEF